MGSKKMKRHRKVQRVPPHRGSVILNGPSMPASRPIMTPKAAERLRMMTAVGMLSGMAAELTPDSRPVMEALAKVAAAAHRATR